MSIETHTDDLRRLLSILPKALQEALAQHARDDLIEVVMDLGRAPEARYPGASERLREAPISRADLDATIDGLGPFNADNRAGIEGTLHRVAAIRNRAGQIIGLTLRVGRAVSGTIDSMRDLVESGRGVLLLGPPGVGKTTRLREVARVLADDFGKRVVVVDTSNEIAGDGDVPHPAIGSARRMQVPKPDLQHAVMIEAVENHMPEAIIVDEIGTSEETVAARTIAERGVQLVGTAHGNDLTNLVTNPTLNDLVGGIQTVVLSDEEARYRGTQKTVTERRGRPTFEIVVEIVDRDTLIVHRDAAQAVDDLLRRGVAEGERRGPTPETDPAPRPAERPARRAEPHLPPATERARTQRIYPYALSRDSLDRVIRQLRLNAQTVGRPEQADLVVALRARADDQRLRQAVAGRAVEIHTVKKNSTAQMRRLLEGVFNVVKGVDDDQEVNAAIHEAEAASRRVLDEGVAVELAPRGAQLRKVQHRIAMRHKLLAESEGSEPQRHLIILPPEDESRPS